MNNFKFLLIGGIIAFMLSSCATTSLYYWGGTKNNATKYEEFAYQMYKKQSPEALCAMLCVYEDIVQHPTGTRQVPPPGICAEYAYYLSMPETAETFAQHATKAQKIIYEQSDYGVFFPEYAKKLFEQEIRLYPESAIFIQPLISKLTQR